MCRKYFQSKVRPGFSTTGLFEILACFWAFSNFPVNAVLQLERRALAEKKICMKARRRFSISDLLTIFAHPSPFPSNLGKFYSVVTVTPPGVLVHELEMNFFKWVVLYIYFLQLVIKSLRLAMGLNSWPSLQWFHVPQCGEVEDYMFSFFSSTSSNRPQVKRVGRFSSVQSFAVSVRSMIQYSLS